MGDPRADELDQAAAQQGKTTHTSNLAAGRVAARDGPATLSQVSPTAHLWVPKESEQCQAACGIARMWASLFWSMQFANAVACVYLHYNRERGLALLAVSHKLVVGGLLLKAYLGGVVYWPIGLFGACCEWFFAAGFIQKLRRP